MTQVSFTGNLVRKVGVLRKEASAYKRTKVSFVEFDKNNKNDVQVLSQISRDWGDSFALFNDSLVKTENVRIFGLTTQKKDFMEMEPSKIIGLVSVRDKKHALIKTIESLQKNPMENNYKHIGKALVSSVQAIYNGYFLKLFSLNNVIGFYKNCGFQRVDSFSPKNQLFWFKDI